MIQLTEKVIAVEVPNYEYENARLDIDDLIGIHLKYKNGGKMLHIKPRKNTEVSLIGVIPLDEKQCKDIVEALTERSLSMTLLHGYKNYDSSKKYKSSYPFMQATKSFNSLLESKGLDINKKYAIIKIEK